jgi:hypothetical protein
MITSSGTTSTSARPETLMVRVGAGSPAGLSVGKLTNASSGPRQACPPQADKIKVKAKKVKIFGFIG